MKKPLQACVLGDSFTNTCRPISLERPKVLFPLCNMPLLGYTLEFLETAGVNEAFVFCSNLADQVQAYVDKSKWGPAGSGSMYVQVVVATQCTNAGDALREIDSRRLLTSEHFVLISGDVVCNVDLKSAVAQHKLRCETDPECCMTMFLKTACPSHSTRALQSDLVVIVDEDTSQILAYSDEASNPTVDIDPSVMIDHPNLSFRYDLMDCNVDICSQSMISKVADEYDYQDLRKHFVTREVADRELGLHVYAKIIQKDYAARVFCPRTYDAVSRDVVRRWAYPLVLDNNFLDDHETSFKCRRGNRYLEDGVTLARTCSVAPGCVLGSGTEVADEAVVEEHSTVGRH